MGKLRYLHPVKFLYFVFEAIEWGWEFEMFRYMFPEFDSKVSYVYLAISEDGIWNHKFDFIFESGVYFMVAIRCGKVCWILTWWTRSSPCHWCGTIVFSIPSAIIWAHSDIASLVSAKLCLFEDVIHSWILKVHQFLYISAIMSPPHGQNLVQYLSTEWTTKLGSQCK